MAKKMTRHSNSTGKASGKPGVLPTHMGAKRAGKGKMRKSATALPAVQRQISQSSDTMLSSDPDHDGDAD